MLNTHPYQRIPSKHRVAVFLSFLALTLVLMFVLLRIDVPLQTTAAPKGIVSYELAGSVNDAQLILDSWNPTVRLYAAFSLGLDYLYMPAYAIAIGLACAWAAELWSKRRRSLAAIGVGLAWGLMVAALCDAVENVALVTDIAEHPMDIDEAIGLVAAETGQRIDLAHHRCQALRHGAQQLVADAVAERIVDPLEMIEIEEDQRHL